MSVTLNFHVCHQNITRADSCILVADSLNYAYAHFDFCSSDWDGLIKTAVFTRGQDTYEQILEDDQCLIPWEVLPEGKGIFTVSVFAGNRITTNVVRVKLDASGWSFALESSQPPTEGVYSQILTRLADVEDTVVESAESAAQSATSAAESAQSAEQSMEAAQTAKNAAQEAAGSVTQYSKTSESWAVGGTGTRTGEDTDNSKYYAEQAGAASQTAVSASNTATGAAQAATQAAGSASQSAQTAAEGAQIVQELYGGAVSDITAAKTAAVGAIQTKGDQVLDSIPEDYTDLSDDVTALKADLNDFSKLAAGYNLIDPTTIVDGEFWSGATATSGSYSRTPLIAVKPNTAYTFANTEVNYWDASKARARTIVFFTADGTYISPRIDNTGNFTTPENCAFVGVSFYQNARKVILIEGTYDITTQTMVYIPYLADALKVDADSIDGLSVDNISDYKVTGKNLFDKTKAVSGLLKQYPKVDASEITYTSDYIPVKANVSYIIWHDYIESMDFSLRSYVLYDVLHQKVTGESGDKKNFVITPTVDGYLRFSGYNVQIDRTQVEVGTVPTTFEPYKEVFPNKALLNDSQLAQVNNILYGKKWVVCGDSFTNGGGTGTKISDGKYKDRNYTYPWIIGNRNNMEIVRFFEGGRTLAFPANPDTFTNSLTNPNADFYYQNIPEDADYVTIYLGINDEHHKPNGSAGDGEDNTGVIPIGTIDDATTATYYGAWNVVLTWLITNRPNVHIGIIVTNGNASDDNYRLAQIAIAQKYGIPYIDMNGDGRTPAMIRTSNPNIPSAIKQALIQKWAVDPSSNTHPNDAAHLFESAFIENFLRSI